MEESINKSNNSINKVQVFIGLTFLFIGGSFYLFSRPPDVTFLIYRYTPALSLYKVLPNIFRVLGNSFPDFIHVFSFILITAGISSCGKRGYILISLCWFILDCAFELGQRYNSFVLRIIPDWFERVIILESVEGYFSKGTFDFYDIVAIFLGATTAYLVLLITMNKMGKLCGISK